jgi:hypothetical protein
MFKKSFSEILQLNLNSTVQFKIKPPEPPEPSEPPEPPEYTINSTDQYILELYDLFLKEYQLKYIYGSRSFYKKLFKKPVEKLFYWCEDEWQGQQFVIYKYKNKYIYAYANFGSCEGCDYYPYNTDLLNKSFNSLNICNDIDNINIHKSKPEYTHPEFIKEFNKFKIKCKKKEQRHQDRQEHTQEHTQEQFECKESKESKESKSWSSLFK